jgi:hypothetical protein
MSFELFTTSRSNLWVIRDNKEEEDIVIYSFS